MRPDRTPAELRELFEAVSRQTSADEAFLAIYRAGRLDAAPAKRTYRNLADRRLPVDLRQRSIRVLAAVAALNGIGVEAMTRDHHGCAQAARPVSEAMWCLRQTGMSFPAIAIACKRANHTTVIDGCRRVETRLAVEAGLREALLEVVAGVMAGEDREAGAGRRLLRSVA